ncbi:diguanylate cyclase domain-containing protein [[Eubacterium] hominis]|uniref:diguanylate cyclase domain-containing protein n=1 Tax=[Eubacterium] hominis TaxID=2764325 RepID=UPI003A4DF075
MFKKRRLTANLMFLSIIPLLVFGLFVTLISSLVIYKTLSQEVEHGLNVLVHATYENYELRYPGEFKVENGHLYKGNADIEDMIEAIDDIKAMSGTDATIFIGTNRYLTTILKDDGTRAVDTKAADEVIETVLNQGKEYFSDHVLVNGNKYFGYYMPLRNAKQEVIGMLFVGKPSVDVLASIENNILLVCIVALLVMVISVGIAMYYSKKIIIALNKFKEYLRDTANGDLTAQIDPCLLEREDEIGEMGKFAVMLQESLCDLVGKDSLTGLHNRQSCNVVLQSLMEKSNHEHTTFAIAMGDVDLFKHINDTYGHQAGDHVLKQLSNLIKEHMEHQGFVFRWGGEEFLLIYEDSNKEQAHEQLKQLQELIKQTEITWNHQPISISVTFGVTDSGCEKDMETLIHHADTYLYIGKKEGRNCIILEHAEEE